MSGLVKLLGVALALCGALSITFITLYALNDGENIPSNDDADDYTPAQVQAAARVLENMDQTADPCQDFYQYSCGGWMDKTILSPTEGRTSTFDAADDHLEVVLLNELSAPVDNNEAESITKSKNFYKACMNMTTIEANGADSAIKSAKSVGGWPMGGDDKPAWDINDVKDWAYLLHSFATEMVEQSLISIYVGVDEADVRDHLASADQPGLFLGTEKFYMFSSESAKNKNLKQAYITYASDLAELYCKANGKTCDRNTIENSAEAVYNMENEIASIIVPPQVRSADDSLTFNKKTVKEFKTGEKRTVVGPLVEEMLKVYFKDVEVTIEDSFIFNDASAPFFDALNGWLTAQSTETIQNLLVFRSLAGATATLGEQWMQARDRYNEVRNGISARKERYKTCIALTNSALSFPVGAMYVEKAFSKEAKDQTDTMIENVISTFENTILDEQTSWMDDATKEEAHSKAKQVEPFIGYPEYIIDDQDKMDADYADYSVAADLCFNNVLEGNKRKFVEDINSLTKPTQRDRWSTGPAIVNAWYSPTRNTITFPAGILQAPFFDVGQSVAMNYGGIGMVIGHELTHGFDDQGSHYDGIGNKRDWWSPETKTTFEGRAQCLADQYSGYYWPQAGMNLAGDSENGENIADNGGIRETYYAYQKWKESNTDKKLPGLDFLSEEQQLFVGYAQVWCAKYTDAEAQSRVLTDVHAPGPFRVLGPLSNFDKFWEAFNCKKGDGYYPPNANQDKVCEVWGTNESG